MADLKISALTASTTPLAGTEVLPIVQSSTTVKVAVSDLTAGRAVSTAALTATGLITAPKGSSAGVTIGDVTTNSNSVLRLQGTSAGYNWQIANNLNSGGIEFTQSTATGGTTYTTPKFEMLNTGNFNIAAGNVVIGTSGKGIDFSATAGTGTSELLADYEEGTFTPVVAGTGTAGTATYATQVGRYTKIGRMVSVTLYVDWSGHTGTGSCVIQGLPFASAAVAGIQYSFTISDLNGYTLSALNVMLASMNSGAQQIGLQQTPAGGGTITSAIIDANASIAISGSYIV